MEVLKTLFTSEIGELLAIVLGIYAFTVGFKFILNVLNIDPLSLFSTVNRDAEDEVILYKDFQQDTPTKSVNLKK